MRHQRSSKNYMVKNNVNGTSGNLATNEIVNINENSNCLLLGIERLIEQTGRNVAIYLNTTISCLYWSIGNYIVTEIRHETYSEYGQQILATLSQRLSEKFGKGYSYSALMERQKRISIDSADYYLDLLFYHRKLNCLVAIDLKLGKFQPQYKGQMELYLKYLQKYEKHPHENSPIGLLLCSEGNSKHIELLMLDEENIKVAQYLTTFPDKQWFIDKLNKSIAIAQEKVKQ